MSWGKIKIRNASPFPVTFYALGGPTVELGPDETKTTRACLIWFSTRVKGPGDAINLSYFEQFADEYRNILVASGVNPQDWEEGAGGVAAGSILGFVASELSALFKVKNTNPSDDVYFGAKKEGVYGSSDLVVYATLDPIYKLNQLHKIWYLHIECDNGQVTPPYDSDLIYTKPDLSAYADTMFIRACNSSGYLSATQDQIGVELVKHSLPYNPLEYPSYWTIHPEDGDDTKKIKILNIYSQKWLTDFSSQGNTVGLYPIGDTDYEDQHWNITEICKNPEIVTINNSYTGGNLYADNNVGIGIFAPDYPNQHFTIQTFTIDINNIPEGITFRIMHAQTGKYITLTESGDAFIYDTYNDNQIFYLKNINGDIKICSVAYNAYLTFYWTDSEYKLSTCSMEYTAYEYCSDQVWEFSIDPEFAGIYIKNKQGENKGRPNLYYNKDNGFGLYFGYFADQLWVLQLEEST